MSDKIIINHLLDDFDSFRTYLDTVEYTGGINDEDGIYYPGTTLDIPEAIQQEIITKLETEFGASIVVKKMFLRLSVEGTPAPHQAHTDALHSDFGMMLYLNRYEDCIGGTSFVIHKETGMKEHPMNEKQSLVWERDNNIPDAWQILDICPMAPNRACIFNSHSMHRSEPLGGFGTGAEDGRLVLVLFFDLA